MPAELDVTPDKRDTYTLQWPNQKGGTCTIVPSLTYSNGELVGGAGSHIKITGQPNIPLNA